VAQLQLTGDLELGLAAACLGGTVTLLELINATRSIDETLFAGEERVASGADAHFETLGCGAGLIDDPTGAGDRGLFVLGMNVSSHGFGLRKKFSQERGGRETSALAETLQANVHSA